jgi:hypothetical protein
MQAGRKASEHAAVPANPGIPQDHHHISADETGTASSYEGGGLRARAGWRASGGAILPRTAQPLDARRSSWSGVPQVVYHAAAGFPLVTRERKGWGGRKGRVSFRRWEAVCSVVGLSCSHLPWLSTFVWLNPHSPTHSLTHPPVR